MMTEDEAWEYIERKQSIPMPEVAVAEAMRFILSQSPQDLGIMTLRKAFELGYRAGVRSISA